MKLVPAKRQFVVLGNHCLSPFPRPGSVNPISDYLISEYRISDCLVSGYLIGMFGLGHLIAVGELGWRLGAL